MEAQYHVMYVPDDTAYLCIFGGTDTKFTATNDRQAALTLGKQARAYSLPGSTITVIDNINGGTVTTFTAPCRKGGNG